MAGRHAGHAGCDVCDAERLDPVRDTLQELEAEFGKLSTRQRQPVDHLEEHKAQVWGGFCYACQVWMERRMRL